MDEHWQSCLVPDSKVEDILKFTIETNSISSGNQDLKSRMDKLQDWDFSDSGGIAEDKEMKYSS